MRRPVEPGSGWGHRALSWLRPRFGWAMIAIGAGLAWEVGSWLAVACVLLAGVGVWTLYAAD